MHRVWHNSEKQIWNSSKSWKNPTQNNSCNCASFSWTPRRIWDNFMRTILDYSRRLWRSFDNQNKQMFDFRKNSADKSKAQSIKTLWRRSNPNKTWWYYLKCESRGKKNIFIVSVWTNLFIIQTERKLIPRI